MEPWDPEHGVDRELALRLVGAIWPDLGRDAVYVGSGWDVDVWRFGGFAVRFPRRALGVTCLENELVVLPAIADRVPLPVPRPLRIAEPAFGYPARFYLHAFLDGTPLIRAGLPDDALADLAAPLGRFLARLHAIDLALLRERGLVDDRRGGVAEVAARGLARLDRVALDGELAARARALLSGALPDGDQPRPSLIHGDCHAANLLTDDRGLSGVIDWGDCAAGDRAVDLAAAWSIVPVAARGAFRAAYGGIEPATWARAQLHAISRHGIALLAWGQDRGDAAATTWAVRSLARALAQ